MLLSQMAPASTAQGTPFTFPKGRSQTINIVKWDSNQLPKIYERSDQLPLTNDELVKLSQAGFDSDELVKMVQERRCACDASADGLIRLKKAGVPKAVISAVSLHSLKPNRSLSLWVTLDFAGESQSSRENFLYFFVDDGPLTRVFTANLNELLRRKYRHETMVDKSDILLAKTVRRVQLAGEIPLKKYGEHTVMVVSSASPSLTHPSQLSERERETAQVYTFDYPRSSLQSLCQLSAGYKRDAVLEYRWHFQGSRFDCEWD